MLVRIPPLPFRELILSLVFITTTTAPAMAQKAESESGACKALWDQATLTIANTSSPVQRVRDKWPCERRVGSYLIRLNKNLLEVREFESLHQVWAETASADCELQLVGSNDKTIYLSEVVRINGHGQVRDARVLCRNLTTGKKLEDIVVPLTGEKKPGRCLVIGAIAKSDCIYLLTMVFSDEDVFTPKPVSYRVTKYSGTVDWSTAFDSAGGLETPGAFILGTLGPALDGYSSQTLVEMESQIVVSAGPLENLQPSIPRPEKSNGRFLEFGNIGVDSSDPASGVISWVGMEWKTTTSKRQNTLSKKSGKRTRSSSRSMRNTSST